MPSTTTVTAKTGPGVTVTAQVTNNVQQVCLLLGGRSVLQVFTDDGKVREYDIAASTTFTATISVGNAAITISQ